MGTSHGVKNKGVMQQIIFAHNTFYWVVAGQAMLLVKDWRP